MSAHNGFMINDMVNIKSLIIKFGNSNLLINQFYSLLNKNGKENKKVKKVVDRRWFFYFLAINDIVIYCHTNVNLLINIRVQKSIKSNTI